MTDQQAFLRAIGESVYDDRLLAPRPFHVPGGEDRPPRRETLNRLIAMNELLGVKGRFEVPNREHRAPTEEPNKARYELFETHLIMK